VVILFFLGLVVPYPNSPETIFGSCAVICDSTHDRLKKEEKLTAIRKLDLYDINLPNNLNTLCQQRHSDKKGGFKFAVEPTETVKTDVSCIIVTTVLPSVLGG
jgi:hypothetical protein